MNVYLSSDAEQDLVDGYWFYEYQELGAGAHFKSCLLNDAERLRTTGGSHPIVSNFHRALSQVFPFSIYYRMDDEQSLTVVAILDQRQNPSKLRRLLKNRN
ncbi:MAG: type II toxin-antitoxin system RelE/ParE family toxin [Pirellulaceae bacterium]|nr:type II toxin-antitoxin system RelE/ParE family toxin [Pirellulaceae bacterium]